MDDKTVQSRLDRLFASARERATASHIEGVDYLLVSRHVEGVSTPDEEERLAALCSARPDVAELVRALEAAPADSLEIPRVPLFQQVVLATQGVIHSIRRPWGIAAVAAAACLCMAALYFACWHGMDARPGSNRGDETSPLVFRGVHVPCTETNEPAGATNASPGDAVN